MYHTDGDLNGYGMDIHIEKAVSTYSNDGCVDIADTSVALQIEQDPWNADEDSIYKHSIVGHNGNLNNNGGNTHIDTINGRTTKSDDSKNAPKAEPEVNKSDKNKNEEVIVDKNVEKVTFGSDIQEIRTKSTVANVNDRNFYNFPCVLCSIIVLSALMFGPALLIILTTL